MLCIFKTIFKKTISYTSLVWTIFLIFGQAGHAQKTGIVVADKLNVRHSPSRDASVAGILTKGTAVEISGDTSTSWVKVNDNHISGYVRNRPQYISFYPTKNKSVKKNAAKVFHHTDIDDEIQRTKQKTEEIKQTISQQTAAIQKDKEKEKEVLQKLDTFGRQLNQTRRDVNKLQRELTAVSDKIYDNIRQTGALAEKLKTAEQYIKKRVKSFYKLNRIGKMHVLASADSVYDFILRKNAMQTILDHDNQVLSDYIDNKERLTALRGTLEEIKTSKLILKRNLSLKIKALDQAREQKAALLKEIRTQKALGLAALDELKQYARELSQTIEALDQGFKRDLADQAQLAFLSLKGRLRMPVKGRITSRFGDAEDSQFHVKTFHSGIKIETDRGEPVQAISAGEVLFADWLRGYGNMIIIDHGNNYYSVYAHTEELFKSKGDTVGSREVIATVGESGSFVGPGLHFEIRHRSTPLNPLEWLNHKG